MEYGRIKKLGIGFVVGTALFLLSAKELIPGNKNYRSEPVTFLPYLYKLDISLYKSRIPEHLKLEKIKLSGKTVRTSRLKGEKAFKKRNEAFSYARSKVLKGIETLYREFDAELGSETLSMLLAPLRDLSIEYAKSLNLDKGGEIVKNEVDPEKVMLESSFRTAQQKLSTYLKSLGKSGIMKEFFDNLSDIANAVKIRYEEGRIDYDFEWHKRFRKTTSLGEDTKLRIDGGILIDPFDPAKIKTPYLNTSFEGLIEGIPYNLSLKFDMKDGKVVCTQANLRFRPDLGKGKVAVDIDPLGKKISVSGTIPLSF